MPSSKSLNSNTILTATNYATVLNGLHSKWKPHPGQIRVGQPLIKGEVDEIFIQAGRNWGKTEFVAYLLWRYANTAPGSENYYFSPFMKQSREILWAPQRIQGFGPMDLVETINETEMRITFTNGAFLKLDGSDNVNAYRGIKPRGLIIYDEFKDFRPEFHVAFDPNRAAHKAPLVIIGTPPDKDCQFTDIQQTYQTHPRRKYFEAPSWENPHLDKDWLKQKRKELYDRGEGDVWEREYGAKFVRGGPGKIFPMLSKNMVQKHDTIMERLHKDRKKLQWFVGADPAAATCFGVLYLTLNPYTKTWYVLDEVYEKQQSKMSVDQIGRRIQDTKEDLWEVDSDWRNIYDEAETWFANEMMDRFSIYFEPCHKAVQDKESGLSLIKDIMLQNKIVISDRCKFFFWELDNYVKDRHGKIPKLNDHLIDVFRYVLGASHYSLNQEVEYKEELDENFRGARISDDFPDLNDYGEQLDTYKSI